jgi:uncharacterized membrane protein
VENSASSLPGLVLGSFVLRPYVFAFLVAFLIAAVRDLGAWRTALFGGWVWAIAFLAEVSSTRNGFPFGLYHYTEATRGTELFLSNVPFFDSLSFVFLAYAAYALARASRVAVRLAPLSLLSGVLMMALDVVIDPLAVRGDRWFLGHIFWYAESGRYFGVPVSNFAGWWLVGTVGVGGYLLMERLFEPNPARGTRPALGIGLYYGVLGFNLATTAWIGEWSLVLAGSTLHIVLGIVLYRVARGSGVLLSIARAGAGSRTGSPSEA